MNWLLFIEQIFNGLQFGVTLFLIAAGLTLIFGIMDLVNLAHGSFVMIGAYFGVTLIGWTDNYLLSMILALIATLGVAIVTEVVVLRTLYQRNHMDQVLATFGLILFFNEMTHIIWGSVPLDFPLPAMFSGSVELLPGVLYPTYRLAMIVVGFAIAGMLYFLIAKTRLGMLIRAGASNREMIGAMGVDIKLLFTAVFGIGCVFSGLAGLMVSPISFVEPGMGEPLLILAFVVIIIGGIGSIRGAFIAAILAGLVDTVGRSYLPELLRAVVSETTADAAGPALASMLIYILMVCILFFKPSGLFPARTG